MPDGSLSEIDLMAKRINVLEEEIQHRIDEKKAVCAAINVDWQSVVNLGDKVASALAAATSKPPDMPELEDVLRRLKPRDVRSGAWVLCLRCGYEGHAYGTPTSSGVSAPWCPRCECNTSLLEINPPETPVTQP